MATYDEPVVAPLGDSALTITFGDDIGEATHQHVRRLSAQLARTTVDGMVEYIPAFTSVTVIYDPGRRAFGDFRGDMEQLLHDLHDPTELVAGDLIEVPVCYGVECGPDLAHVASHNGLRPEDVIELHCEPDYLVYMIGFVPGFPYLGGMSERIATPRRETPRESIPAGSVGIAGTQAGIYPLATPGGWQLIGRTALRLFRPESERPSLLAAGDRVRFSAVSHDDYERLLEREHRS